MPDSQTVIYEVLLEVEPTAIDTFRPWLDHHIAEMIALDGFLEAEVLEPLEAPNGTPETVHLITRYRLRDRQSLDHYLEHHAPRMRQDGLDRFGGQFRASRRLWKSLGQFLT